MNNLSSPVALIKKSWKIFFEKDNFVYFLKVYLPFLLIGLTSLLSKTSRLDDSKVQSFIKNPYILIFFLAMFIFGVIIGAWTTASGYEAIKRVVKKEELDFKETYKASWRYLLKFFTVSFLVGLITIFGLILLVVPGIVFSTLYSFALFGIVSGTGIKESMVESKKLVSGKFWKVLGRLTVFMLFSVIVQIVFALIPYGLGGLVISLLGAVFILPHYILYSELKEG